MTQVLEQYQFIIDQLVPVIQSPEFDTLFKNLTKDISKPHQFQIKLEINRLKQPNPRPVDLRGHVDGHVEPYKFQGKTHYMDSVATKVFEAEIAHYGAFTVGVYEKATNTENNYRVLHQKEQKERLAEKEKQEERKKIAREKGTKALEAMDEAEEQNTISYSARKIQFQSYAIRAEERMNFSIAVVVIFPSGESIKATSSDLSVSGCKIKLPFNTKIRKGEKIRLELKGLEEEFTLGLTQGIEYEIVGVDTADDFKYARMKRTYSENIAAFDEFLGNFINGNKRRYKVNMENTEDAVIIKGYEQYYAPRVATLPVFISQDNKRLRVSSILTTENNKPVMRYWFNDAQHFVLSQVFGHKRLVKLLKGERETYLYSFTHNAGERIHHYAVLHQELLNSEFLRHLFWGFGSRKASWRVFKLHISKSNFDSAHVPLSLPDSASEEVKQMNRPPSARVQSVIGHTIAIIGMTDVTERSENKKYQMYKFDKNRANQLKVCGIPRAKEPPKLEIVAINYVNLRKETRYLYRTQVTVESPPNDPMDGHTRDFSTKGIQIELNEPCTIEKGEIILVALPEMQKITRKFKLTRLPYEVMAVSKDGKIVNVRIYEQGDNHNGKKFFQQLIQTNRSKLTAAEEMQTIPGLPQAMRNMYIGVCPNMPFYIHRKGIRYMINVIGHGGQESSLHQIMARYAEKDQDYNLEPLIKGHLINSLFANELKSMKRQDPPKVRELLIRLNRAGKTVEEAIELFYSDDLSKEHDYRAFIDEAMENDLFFAFRIYISRTGRPDVNYISKELKYVGNYAIHRAKLLEEELWGVIGVGDAIDISDEVLLRYGYNQKHLDTQRQTKKFYFSRKLKNN